MSRTARLILLALCLTFLSGLFSLSKGSISISLEQLLFHHDSEIRTVFWELRLPRTLAAFVSGGLLALSGALMQLLLQNPLADPYVLGISGGAAFFTLLMILLGLSGDWLLSAAWAGSLLSILLILLLAKKHRFKTHTSLLSGIALASGFSAGISFILLLSDANHLHSMLFWLSGDLSGAHFPSFGLIILSIGFVITLLLAPGLNILGRGENEAKALGLPSQKYRILLYLLSSLFTATAVTLGGSIGFVGLIIPHFVHAFNGYDHRLLLPLCVFIGGSFLTLADTLARSLFAPAQIPVGIFMAFLGIPLFVWMLQK